MQVQAFMRHTALYRWLTGLVLCASLLAGAQVQAASIKLNQMALASGSATHFQISPDHRFVVYSAHEDLGGSFWELYRVSLFGGAAVRLNLPLAEGRIFAYAIRSDSQQVVYQSGDDLYSVPMQGPATSSSKLNRVTLSGGVQHKFSISLDSQHVVYRTSDDLYSVPISGPAEAGVKLNRFVPLPADPGMGGAVAADFAVTPDSQRVVYVAQTAPAAFGLLSVPLGGPAEASVLLSNPSPGADIMDFTLSPDSRQVVYLSDQAADLRFELYSVPSVGPADLGVKLNMPLQEGEMVVQFAVSADSTRVVYVKGYELYSAPIAGPASASVQLNDPQTSGRIDCFDLSNDSQWVVFQVGDLYAVPLVGPASAKVQLTDLAATGRPVAEFQISPDSQRVVYSGYEAVTSPLELYSVPVGGPPTAGVKLNRPLPTADYPLTFHISPDSQSVVYEAHQDAAESNELYRVPISGPADTGSKLNGPEVQPVGVRPAYWQISSDNNQVMYVVGTDLYAADTGERTVGFAQATVLADEHIISTTLPVTLDQPSVMTTTVIYAVTGGNASGNGIDYMLPSGVLTFAPGETLQAILVAISHDDLPENAETAEIALSQPTNARLATASLILTIVDDREHQLTYLPFMVKSECQGWPEF
jgi:Tol biopolymer transport system component